jgi:membrane protein
MARGAVGERERGRQATRPGELGRKGWRDVLFRTKDQVTKDHISIVAAGCAFYGLLAIFPAIAALVAIWGLAADPQQVEQQMSGLTQMMPGEAAGIIQGQVQAVTQAGPGTGLAAIAGLLFALYSAMKGTQALMEGLNIAYDEEEKRGFFRYYLVALLLTLGIIGAVIAALAIVVIIPAVLNFIGLGGIVETIVALIRWPILFVGALFVLAALYRYAPSRDEPQWRWVSWGAVIATVLWVLGSIAFSIYVRNFGSYNETYGTLGAVVILLMWFWLSAFIVLLGAELNSETEHQTEQDTTEGKPQPRGKRGAHVADTVGRKP